MRRRNPAATAAHPAVSTTTELAHPYKKPQGGPRPRVRYSYIPPARGMTAPSSAKQSAPQRASKPPTAHAARDSMADPAARATSLPTRKIADPITFPITTAVADHRPRPRINSEAPRSGEAISGGLEITVAVSSRI